ncbi:unnamed protein product [Schistocephalus solidus]|uniref:Secreted protein n=1 Tax=Schistocephalus solidus TaxID=70667 RepID=A0A183T3M0_SCHSO|nr:unnamed protein product [Schistocephalus solidus]
MRTRDARSATRVAVPWCGRRCACGWQAGVAARLSEARSERVITGPPPPPPPPPPATAAALSPKRCRRRSDSLARSSQLLTVRT